MTRPTLFLLVALFTCGPARYKKLYADHLRLILPLLGALGLLSCRPAQGVTLFDAGRSTAVLVVPADSDTLRLQSIASFQRILERSTGSRLPEVATLAEAGRDRSRIVFGPSAETDALGYAEVELQPEAFRLITRGNDLIVLAVDRPHGPERPMNIWGNKRGEEARVTQWALGYLLDRYLGVRFLWPGGLGTVVPTYTELRLPDLDVSWQQPLVRRSFNVIEDNDANIEWLNYHQFAGKRTDYHWRHSFRPGADNGPWEETHPHLLAKNPRGVPSTFRGRPHFFKLCLTEPETTSEIVRLWQAAGAPDYWDVTPNDGNGFCTCDDCMALDEEYGHVRYTKDEVWNRPGHVSLTGRYAWFWNQLLDRMKPINPDVQIGVYLYGAYREPPEYVQLREGIVGEMVSGFDFGQWRDWEAAGIDGIALRPNWLYMGAGGPHLPLEQAGDYLALARNNGMLAISLDCFHEYWATQGPYYYLLTRMVERADLSKEAVLEEYALAFGAAAPAIRDYLAFWSDYSREVAWNIPAGGRLSQDSSGLYERRSREVFGEPLHPLKGHWLMMPYVYTPEKLAAADALLVRGQALTDDPLTRRRLEYLRDGLRLVEHVNAYIGDGKPPFADAKLRALQDFRTGLQRKYDYWNSMDLFFLAYWGISGEEVDLTGM